MGWPSRAGPRAGPSTLRSASARRRRRGSPRCAARASPLHLSGLVGSSPFPRSLSSASGSAAVFATLRKRAAPPPGSHPARGPRPSASLFGTRGSPGSLLLDPRVDLRARGPVGPAATSADARLCSPHGGTLAPSSSPPPGWGGTGGDAVRSWEAPCRPGAEGWQSRTWSCALAVPDALAVRYSNPIVLRPSWGKQVSSDKASPATHCVTLVSRNRGSPDRFESQQTTPYDIDFIVHVTENYMINKRNVNDNNVKEYDLSVKINKYHNIEKITEKYKTRKRSGKRRDSAWSCCISNFHAGPARCSNPGALPRPGRCQQPGWAGWLLPHR